MLDTVASAFAPLRVRDAYLCLRRRVRDSARESRGAQPAAQRKGKAPGTKAHLGQESDGQAGVIELCGTGALQEAAGVGDVGRAMRVARNFTATVDKEGWQWHGGGDEYVGTPLHSARCRRRTAALQLVQQPLRRTRTWG